MAKAISETGNAVPFRSLQREARCGAYGSEEGQQLILSFLGLSRKLKQDGLTLTWWRWSARPPRAAEEVDAGLALEALPELIDRLGIK